MGLTGRLENGTQTGGSLWGGGNLLKVTNVKIRLKQSGKLKAVAMVTLDNALIINDITLFENAKGKLIVQLPRTEKAKDNGQESVVPLSGELRHDITSEVKKSYARALQAQRRRS
ncbi:hypothetical protein B5F35_17715 [Anaeromassilibacillus sp. An200]|nr:hypothetical protein B5F35_17715 [Anaeromassilibacillus sp. An200]